jgi:hypothetical protein
LEKGSERKIAMQPFRRVEDKMAGPTALGILVPPGQRCLVILRPRALPWDLLPTRLGREPGSLVFCDFSRDEAAGLARQIQRQLEQFALERHNPLEIQGHSPGESFLVWLKHGEFFWVVCPRRPGQPYQEMRFASREEAQEAARQIAAYVCPAPEANQEYYFNTQHFSR